MFLFEGKYSAMQIHKSGKRLGVSFVGEATFVNF